MTYPNLFAWATSELSQDALICWWLEWARPENLSINPTMQSCGNVFLQSLLEKHGVFRVNLNTLQIYRQYNNIDILVIINNEYALLIEDKTDTSAHGNQLETYIAIVKKNYPKCHVLPTYVKTGSQSRYKKEEDAGYKLFLRDDFLKILRTEINKGIKNDILIDFHNYLENRQSDILSFKSTPVSQWTWNAWVGFYEYLQTEIEGLTWNYVSNPNGGFLGAWWYFKEWKNCEVYLQIEQGLFCFKIAVEETDKQSEMRNLWYSHLMASVKSLGLPTIKRPPRFGKGTWMTAAIVDPIDWLVETNGCIDLTAVMSKICQAQKLIDETAKANP